MTTAAQNNDMSKKKKQHPQPPQPEPQPPEESPTAQASQVAAEEPAVVAAPASADGKFSLVTVVVVGVVLLFSLPFL